MFAKSSLLDFLLPSFFLAQRVTSRQLEQCRIGFGALDVRVLRYDFAVARIAALEQHRQMQLWRIPALDNNLNRPVVSEISRGNCGRSSRSVRHHTVHNL